MNGPARGHRLPESAGWRAARGARGLVPEPPRAYLWRDMWKYFARFSPLRAIRDLRRFLASRKRYEIFTLFGAAAVTWTIMWVFLTDSRSIKIPYKRDIVYVESWPLDRTDADIKAQQKIDVVKKTKQQEELERRQKERQAQFKKVDDWLRSWGI